MKQYVLGLVVNKLKDRILLIEKKRPDWMAGRWNGVGGKIEDDETPIKAMHRESFEETDRDYDYRHVITFVCPGGTVYVFLAITEAEKIHFHQKEDEALAIWYITSLPVKLMANLKWIIPLALSSVQKPTMINQIELGSE